ncbi:probable flavin-containing monoamine oxidase A [Sinocyclocheilus grahami]|uniref:Amine oxidase n=1 Tax=Sinocyclocheilus grahami TaxID=75366 RepID=A0A672SU40_SINGR|nr:PREDICTED: probable flavin-containing monoamine oxidase A [Sinocyclocheilus grahami]
MSEDQFDVVVVGAGLSGLSAARRLQKRNPQLSVMVLEARDRVGGRTVSKDLPAANGVDQWDMGGQWVSSSQTHVMELIRELGLEVFPQYTEGKKVHHVGGPHAKIKMYTTSMPSYSPLTLLDFTQILRRIDHLTQTISVEDPMSCPNAELFDGMTLHTFMEKHIWTTQVKEELALCSRIVFGLEPSQVSFLFFLMYSAAAGGTLRLLETTPGSGQEFRVKGGTQQLSEKLVEQIGKEGVRLGAAVTTICQNSENIKVTTSAGTITCKAVIVACPSHLAAQIRYEPALPAERQRLTQCLPVGHMTKFIITYPTAFWKEKGFSGEIVARPSEDCPLSVTFDATSPRGNPALVGFITGVQARDWCDRKMEERRDGVISSLVKYLGPEASTYIHYEEKDWAKEEWSGGCPVNVMTPGMLTYYHPSLRKPFGRIHWAGTETATQWCGYIDGAIQAGQRTAMEVLAQMFPSSLSREELEAVRASLKHSDPRKGSKCKSSKCYYLFGVVMTAAALVTAYLLAKPELGFQWI